MIKPLLTLCLFILCLSLAVAGCSDPKERSLFTGPPESPTQTMLKTPFVTPIEPALYELPSQALATWRDYARYRPVLVLFSTHPLLDPVLPEARIKGIHTLLKDGSTADIVNRARTLTNDPAILPPETLSVAIDNGLFSEIVVVFPALEGPEAVKLDLFRERALGSGFLTQEEVKGLNLKDGVISGSVRGTPLRIPHPKQLPKLEKPIILHIDLGYFKDMYINEIKTPSYGMIHQLATGIRDAKYAALATTLSFSNQEVGFALESRFLLRDLADLLRKPQLLAGGTPASWEFRSKALYHSTMLAQEKAFELTLAAAQQSPPDAAALHALALELFAQGLSDEGFATLDRAVALDKGYGLEYLSLAEQGFTIGQPQKSIELLGKAAATFPGNPFIRKELANRLIQAGRVKEARPLIAALQELTWSEYFYPDFPGYLKSMGETAAVDPVIPPASDAATRPAAATPAKPAKERMPGFNHMGMPGR